MFYGSRFRGFHVFFFSFLLDITFFHLSHSLLPFFYASYARNILFFYGCNRKFALLNTTSSGSRIISRIIINSLLISFWAFGR